MTENNFSISGELHHIGEEKEFSKKFKKLDFVLKINDNNYEQFIKFQMINDRCDLMDKFRVGQDVVVYFNLKGRPFEKGSETLYFTNLEAWRIKKADGDETPAPAPAQKLKSKAPVIEDIDEDLPF